MKRNHIIAIASLTSTSLLILILYWLLAFFQVYPENPIFVQSSCINSSNTFILHSLDSIQQITLILAIICMIMEMFVFVLLCNSRQKQKYAKREESSKFSETVSDDNTQNELKKIEIQTPITPESQSLQSYNYYNSKKYKLYYVIFFPLIILTETIIGHHIKILIAFHQLQLCLPQNQTLSTLFTNHIILVSLIGYTFLSTVTRTILNFLWKKPHNNPEHLSTQPQITHNHILDQQKLKQNEQIVTISLHDQINKQQPADNAQSDTKSQRPDKPTLLKQPTKIFSNLKKKLSKKLKESIEIRILEEKTLPKTSSSKFYHQRD